MMLSHLHEGASKECPIDLLERVRWITSNWGEWVDRQETPWGVNVRDLLDAPPVSPQRVIVELMRLLNMMDQDRRQLTHSIEKLSHRIRGLEELTSGLDPLGGNDD